MVHNDFISSEKSRKRYWARSMAGFKYFSNAAPNLAHYSLAAIEAKGYVNHIISQNVDGLHQRAGSKNVLNLHGKIELVRCLSCNSILSRQDFQNSLEELNGHMIREMMHVTTEHTSEELLKIRADGDMDLGNLDLTDV
jgi:NAD-dependent SIR2 family protein deacetylase